ncbi:hypothetical protein FRC12_010445 [Ceratobasidium sp. 428]|nr:hypothetical protein FRC12_010445 [Ceratobasidium sp. 428]
MVVRRPPQRHRRETRTTRPPPHWLTLGAFRPVGKRLMHPPPPSEKKRYLLFVAPRYDVALEDVVANKHLPPVSYFRLFV